MLEITYQLLFLGSPLLLVAMAHGLCIRNDLLNALDKPLDLGLTFRGKRVFGNHKTWRGLVINLIFCTLGTAIQAWLQNRNYLPSQLLLLDYDKYGYLAGVLLGLGMTAGELPNSFVKRQMGIRPGTRKKGLLGVVFFLLDQVDLTIGIWVFMFFLVRPSLLLVSWSFLVTIVVHVTISTLGYALGMRKTIV